MRMNRWKWLLREDDGGGNQAPSGPLADWIDWMLDRYLADRDQEWSDDPTLEELATLLGNVTQSFTSASADGAYDSARSITWQGQSELPWPRLSRLPDGETFQRQLRESTEVELVAGLVDELPEASARALELTERVLRRRPGQPVTTFLGRVGRCYIAGLLPECLLLCRTAMESAAARAVQTAGPEPEAGGPAPASTLERLDALRDAGILSEESLHLARAVWSRGEDALHGESGDNKEVLEAIFRTSEVLVELHPGE